MMKIVYRELNPVLQPNQSESEYYAKQENEVLDGVFAFFKKFMEFYNNEASYREVRENKKRFMMQYLDAKEDCVGRINIEYASTDYLADLLALANERFAAFEDAIPNLLLNRVMTA